MIICMYPVVVPAIETSAGFQLVQSHAILHFLGRAVGFDCDCEDVHTCEIIAMGAGKSIYIHSAFEYSGSAPSLLV